jgi:hypothetical protein
MPLLLLDVRQVQWWRWYCCGNAVVLWSRQRANAKLYFEKCIVRYAEVQLLLW